MSEANKGCAYWKLIADGVVVCAWRGGAPQYVMELLKLKGFEKFLATKDEYEKYRPRRKRKQELRERTLFLPGWPPAQ